MTDREVFNTVLNRFKKTKSFKGSGYSILSYESCGDTRTFEINDNRNPGHSFYLTFNNSGKLVSLDFGH